MNIMKLKDFHTLAEIKQSEALERWRAKADGYGYPVQGMFFFLLPDNVTRRQRGFVVTDNRQSHRFFRTKAELINAGY